MSKRIFYKARAVHDPIKQRYEVHYKTHWYSRWRYWTAYPYEEGHPSHFQAQLQALTRARKECDSLASHQVVYETNA